MLYEAIVKQNLLAETTNLFGRKYPQSSGAQNILRKNVTFVFKAVYQDTSSFGNT